ncbi:MAG: hypothetical protein NTZ09_18835 [Candidatus Hydrogenedentes bacterium]|nr:hypothetical protein [Candidatus Hydrogenedentota bacterium]
MLTTRPNLCRIDSWEGQLVQASNDGNDATFEDESKGTIPSGSVGQDQKLVVEGNGWYGSNDPPAHLDVDFISIE